MNAVKPSLRSLAEQFNALGLPTTETPTGLLVQHGKELVPIHLSKRDLNVLHGQFIEDGHPNDEFAIDALIAELIELVATCPPSGHIAVQRRRGRWEFQRHGDWRTPEHWPSEGASWSAQGEEDQ